MDSYDRLHQMYGLAASIKGFLLRESRQAITTVTRYENRWREKFILFASTMALMKRAIVAGSGSLAGFRFVWPFQRQKLGNTSESRVA